MTVYTRTEGLAARPRDRRAAAKRRNSARNVVAVWLFALTVIGGMIAGVLGSERFRVREVHVYCTNESLREEAAERAEGLSYGTVWLPPTRAIEREIGGLPRARDVRIERESPHALGIHVQPRLPAAVVEVGTRFMLIDEQGVCLNWTGRSREGLMIVRVADPTELAVGEMLNSRDARMFGDVFAGLGETGLIGGARLDLTNANRVEVFTGDGVLGKLGDAELLHQKTVLFGKLLRALKATRRAPIYIDLRVPSHPTYRPIN